MREMSGQSGGLREHNRQETLKRITDVGLELFLANGYDKTTVDEIAIAAGISRRTFFHYFKTKDEIIATQMESYAEAVCQAILALGTARKPLETVASALANFSARFDSPRTIAIARLLRDVGGLARRGRPGYTLLEQPIFCALKMLWPDATRQDGLCVVAMISAGVLRLAIDRWLASDGRLSLQECVESSFKDLRSEI